MEQLASGKNRNRPDLVPAENLGERVTQRRGDDGLHEASLAYTQDQWGFCAAAERTVRLS